MAMWIDERVPVPPQRHVIRPDWGTNRCTRCGRPVGEVAFWRRDNTVVRFLRHYDDPQAAVEATSRASVTA